MKLLSELPLRQRTFLLSAWQEQAGTSALWRFSLEETQRPGRQLFASLKEVIAYVEQELNQVSADEG